MSFEEDIEQHRAALRQKSDSERETSQLKNRERDAAIAAFIDLFEEAVTLLKSKGAQELRVVNIQRGMRGYANLRRVDDHRAVEVGGFFLRNGRLESGRTEVSGVRSLRHGLRKSQLVINTAGTDVRLRVDMPPAGQVLGA